MVPDLYIAWHAGKSNWKNDKLLNSSSIGIEISNPGHGNGYEFYKKKQLKCLINISKLLIKKYFILKKNILGHSDIAPLRKKDPGEKFPWKILASKNIGVWHKINFSKCIKFRGKNINMFTSDEDEYLFSDGFTAFVLGAAAFLGAILTSGTGSPILAIRTPLWNGQFLPLPNLPVALSCQTKSDSFSINFIFTFSSWKAEPITSLLITKD